MVFSRGQCVSCGHILSSAGACVRCSRTPRTIGLPWNRKREISVSRSDIPPLSNKETRVDPEAPVPSVVRPATNCPPLPTLPAVSRASDLPVIWREFRSDLLTGAKQVVAPSCDDPSDCWTPLTCPETDSVHPGDTEFLSCDPVIVSIRRIDEDIRSTDADGSILSDQETYGIGDFEDSSDDDSDALCRGVSGAEELNCGVSGEAIDAGVGDVVGATPNQPGPIISDVCRNCRRSAVVVPDPLDSVLAVTLERVPVRSICRSDRRWKTFVGRKGSDDSSVLLCLQCKELLSDEDRHARRASKKTVPLL